MRLIIIIIILAIIIIIPIFAYINLTQTLNKVSETFENMPKEFLNVEVTPSNPTRNSPVQIKIYLVPSASDDTGVILNEERYVFFTLSFVKKFEEGTPEYERSLRYISWTGADDLFETKNYLSGWRQSFIITKENPYILTFDIWKAIDDYQQWKEIPGRTEYNLTIDGEYALRLSGAVVYREGNENKYTIISSMSNPIIVL